MKLYGGHDYYDSALSMGIDPTIVMVREKHKEISVRDLGGSLLGPEMRLLPSNDQVERVSVVFCGKLYRGAIVPMDFGANQSFWAADKLREFAAKSKDGKVGVYNNWYTRKFEKTKWTLEEYFAPVDTSKSVRDYMILHKIAILVERESKWKDEPAFEVNPTGLKQLGFAKALDPYTAFQELSMWIGGILGGTSPEMVRITDDKVLIENHGYDKHSFRNSSRVA